MLEEWTRTSQSCHVVPDQHGTNYASLEQASIQVHRTCIKLNWVEPHLTIKTMLLLLVAITLVHGLKTNVHSATNKLDLDARLTGESCVVFVTFTQQNYFWGGCMGVGVGLWIWAPRVRAMFGLLFTNEKQEAQNSIVHEHVFVRDFQMFDFQQTWLKTCCESIFLSIPTKGACDASDAWSLL